VELMTDLGPFLEGYALPAQKTLNDIRVEYVPDDGRRYLYANPGEIFDMIFIDPLYSFTAGHNNLYSVEALQLYRSHLIKSGIFCGWMNERHTIPKTTASVFPYSDEFRDWMVAGNEPIRYDPAYMKKGLDAYLTNGDGVYSTGFSTSLQTDEIFNIFIGDRECIMNDAIKPPILTDMNPWLEYYFFREPYDKRLRCD
jgi:hypothetical protein